MGLRELWEGQYILPENICMKHYFKNARILYDIIRVYKGLRGPRIGDWEQCHDSVRGGP